MLRSPPGSARTQRAATAPPATARRPRRAAPGSSPTPVPRGGEQDPFRDPRRCVDEMLTVVQDDQHLFAREVVTHALGQRTSRARLHAQGGDEHLTEQVRIVGRRQLTQPHSIREPRKQLGCDLGRQARLADTAHAGQRHQPRLSECLRHPGHVLATTHERCQLHRQIPRERVEGTQRREALTNTRGNQLKHPLWARQVPQTLLTQIDKAHTNAQIVAHEPTGHLRHQHLTAMTDRVQPRRAVDGWAEIVTAPLLGLTGMHTHPHRRQPSLPERALHLDRARQRIARTVEHDCEPIATSREHDPCVTFDRPAHQLVMTRQSGAHRVDVGFPPARRTLNIREQKRHRPRRNVRHKRTLRPPRPHNQRGSLASTLGPAQGRCRVVGKSCASPGLREGSPRISVLDCRLRSCAAVLRGRDH